MALQGLVGFILSYLNRRGFLLKSGTESGTEKENPLKISGLLWCWEESKQQEIEALFDNMKRIFPKMTRKNNVFIIPRESKKDLRNFWQAQIKKSFKKIKDRHFPFCIGRDNLMESIDDPLTKGAYIFYSNYNGLTRSGKFFNAIERDLEHDEDFTIYLGSVFNCRAE
jgi:hypothetical protein